MTLTPEPELKFCDKEHPYFGEVKNDLYAQCPASSASGIYRCMGNDGHRQTYHVTYGYEDNGVYWWKDKYNT